ncbi:uncharacterized protein LOC115262830 [Aedes albopictus]|uniref:Integrase zinc-binding domain-containing protein n=1 Tax=Aedes albopictus TaxID=7160 RepID=A0ABM1XWR8_AEDAL
MNEKLEREKEYLARKHELLRQQDEDAASIQSSRSGRSQASSRQKVEAWFNQQLMSVDSSDNASNQRQKLSGQTAGPVGSSTPMETSRIIDEGLLRAHSDTKQNVGSIPRTTDSISIGDSPGVEDDVNPPNAAKQSKVQSLPLVNIQPYVKILDEANPMTSETALTNTGYPPRIIPKLMGNPLPYTAWQRETSEMRKQHLREHQCPEREAELRQSEQREQELIHLLKRSEEQREQDRQRLQEIEEILKKQHDVEAQHQKENYVRRRRELELVNRLKLFEQEYAQEKAKRDEEKQKYLAKEQQLIEQLENLRLSCEQYPAAEQHPAAEQNSVAERCSAAEQRPAADQSSDAEHHPATTKRTPTESLGNISGIIQRGVAVSTNPPTAAPVLGPTSQQLAARQVISRELPVFSGDPIEWPLFISSYNHSTAACGYTESENLLRLQRSLKGVAKDAVSSFLLHPSTVQQVLSTLQTLYGRPEQIVHNLVVKVRATPAPKPERLETLMQFGLTVQNLCGHLQAVGMDNHLSNPILLQELVDKLPANIKFNWALHQENLSVVDLKAFSEYMRKVTAATSGVTSFSFAAKPTKDERPRAKDKAFVNAHAAHEQKDPGTAVNSYGERRGQNKSGKYRSGDATNSCPACGAHDHTAASCGAFKKLSIDGRWNFVKDNKLCRRCLVSHTRWPCEGEVCGINNCEKRHHRLLHSEPKNQPVTDATVTIHRQPVSSTLFKILPVTLYGKSGSVNTFAFLDDGSSVTIIEQTIADKLGVDRRPHSLCIHWTSGINKKIATKELEAIRISEPGSNMRFNLSEVYTVENLGLPEQSLDAVELSKEFSHLRHLPVRSYRGAVPRLLIGLSNSHLLTTTKLREGQEREPIAAKTRIGWVVCGCLGGRDTNFQHRQMHICAEKSDQELHDYVREFFSVESLGVAVAPNLEGIEDQRARRILEETTVRTVSGKFETGLLWKNDVIEFPDSRPMSERRLRCLEKRLEKDPKLYDSVRQQIADYKLKGYIHVVTEEEMTEFDPRRTWYLPLGVVLNPNKPGKVRVIWDAAAKVEGVSLNSVLLKGPDLLTPQLNVTFKFREREVAFSGDIQEMFLQVGIRKEDRSALLFVFRNSPSEPFVTMASDVAIFGATCSPAQSQYVKNRNATENERDHPRAAEAIKNKHYVDDYLDSVDTEEEAVELALEVAEVHRKAGFHIRNWVSNRPSVLEAIGEVNPTTVKSLSMNNQSGFERVLGITWLPDEDLFCFTVSLQNGLESKIAPTKRAMLSYVMKIYDPLGLVGSLVVQGKILLQDVWRAKVGWDENIPENLFARWKLWLQSLKELDNVRIPRSYFPGYDPACYEALELHIFVDGSEQAYSSVAYFRVQDRGQTRCALVASKTKVAPLQLTSVPRLELQAAVIGARLRKTIQDGHSVQIKRTFFWTDSSTVVSWVKSDTRRYRQYVAFRVNEILSLSTTEEWRWLGTKINVADEATKWGKGPNCKPDSRWIRGPAFLYDDEQDWPKDKFQVTAKDTEEELRPKYVCSHYLSSPIIDVSRFSKYERLLRCVAYVHRFCEKLLRRIRKVTSEKNEDISTEDLQNRQPLPKSSSLANLPPLLDEYGLMRVDGRIAAVDYVEHDTKFPIILPKAHSITNLLLDWYHRKFRHGNNETIVNEIRQRFCVPKLRTQIRSISKRCQYCRVYKSTPVDPKMSQLPRCRTTPFLRPFTFVGIDYFGPYLVKVGRSAVKRGAPQEVYTDNGTNFIGASRELENELRKINHTIGSTFTDANTKWLFNPPAAPHMGGCWERMVRSVKTALGTLPVSQKMDDESFMTLQ